MRKLVVVNGATTKCTGSEQSSLLLVPPDLQIEVDGLNPATIVHHIPGDNIIPFGPCKHLGGGMCVPVTLSPWEEGEPSVPFGPDPSLNMASRLKCDLGGTITLLSSGQSNPFISTDCNVSLSAQLFAEWYGRKQNADAIKAQMDAENEAEKMDGWDIAKGTVKESGKKLLSGGKKVADFVFIDDLKSIFSPESKTDFALGVAGFLKVGKVFDAYKGIRRVVRRKPKGGGYEPVHEPDLSKRPRSGNVVPLHVPANVREKVPSGWKISPRKKGDTGVEFYNPANDKQTIRYQPANPKSQHPEQQIPYVTVTDKSGKTLMPDGSLTPPFSYYNKKINKWITKDNFGNKFHPHAHQPANTFKGNLGD